jgi:hypothetical protein
VSIFWQSQNIGPTGSYSDNGNEDVDFNVDYPTKTPGVALDNLNAEHTDTGVDPDFGVKPTGVEINSEAQSYVLEEHNEDGLRQQDLSKHFDIPTAESTLLFQKCSVAAQHKLHHLRRKCQYTTLE